MGQKGLTGAWSKYGGSRHSVVKKAVDREWTCQSCATRHAAEMSPYLYELMAGEYIRVCAICLHDDCAALKAKRAALG